MAVDLDEWVRIVNECKYLPENELKILCDMVIEILVEECNVQPVSAPVTVCGDIHGQYYDLQELFNTGGRLPDTSYIFMVGRRPRCGALRCALGLRDGAARRAITWIAVTTVLRRSRCCWC